MRRRTDARPDASQAASAAITPGGPRTRGFDLPLGDLDPTTRTRARLLAFDVLGTMAPGARCFVTALPGEVRVEFEGRLDAGPGALQLVCRRADRWGLSLGDARDDVVWFALDR